MREIQRVKYRAHDGRTDFTFTFQEMSGGNWRVWVDAQPGYDGRSAGSVQTHRLSAGTRQYICWDGTISSLEDAKRIAALWADCTLEYIRTGNFDEPAGRERYRDHPSLAPNARTRTTGSPSPPSPQPTPPRSPRDRLRELFS